MLSADQLHRRGVNAINAGKVRVARPLLERGLERATDEDLKARIEASLAYVAAETGDPAGGLALCEAALGRPGLRAETRGIVQSQRALLQMRSGDTPGALTSFGEAIVLLASLPDEKARAHLNRGGVYLQQGAGDVAAADFAAAMRDFEAAGLVSEVPKAQHNLGYAAFVQGDLVSALRRHGGSRAQPAGLESGPPRDLPTGPRRGADGGRSHSPRAGRPRRGGANLRTAPVRTSAGARPSSRSPAPRWREIPGGRSWRHGPPAVASTVPVRPLCDSRRRRSSTAPRCGWDVLDHRWCRAATTSPRELDTLGAALVGDRHPARHRAGRPTAG